MTEIKPCPMCGSPAELWSGGVTECYGHDWQQKTVNCTDVMDKHCGMSLDLQMDFWNVNNTDDILIEAWNKIERKA